MNYLSGWREGGSDLFITVFYLFCSFTSLYVCLLIKNLTFSCCRIRQSGLSFEAMFEEVPILMRNSHLVNTLLCEIEQETPSQTKYNFLDLSTR